jgi:acid phosphatase family membrane protein YuiD
MLHVFLNVPLLAALSAWVIAQVVKLPIEYLRSRDWNWALLLRPGGMPSSHSALVTAAAHALGLTQGFDAAIYALAVVVAIVVVYDAMGIRRQAGRHARVINRLVQDLFEGHAPRPDELREVLGHSPMEASVGVILGILVAQLLVSLWASP